MLENNLKRVVLPLLEDLGGGVAMRVYYHVLAGDIQGIANIRVDPRDYSCSESFFRDYAAAELLRKIDLPADTKTLSRKAQETFYECEKQCHVTNIRMNQYLHRCFDTTTDAALWSFVSKCKEFIRRVLGPLPIDLSPRFGKGATYGDRGNLTTVPDKMSSRPTVTKGCGDLLPLVRDTAWFRALYSIGSSNCHPQVTRGNRFTTVPKDVNKRRGICVEPSVNIALQLPVGAYMKDRLARIGLDLLHGQDHHRDLACVGSQFGSYATIDLSNASDTVAHSVVKLLLPSAWYDLLSTLRCSHTRIGGKWVKLEKFSSMGNGFTFELETLIFASIVHASGGTFHKSKEYRNSLVYGDDIIVPVEISDTVISALRWFGFVPNPRKTFTSGDFRESCGGDFFKGIKVRPYYIKNEPHEPQDWIKLANGIRAMVGDDPGSVLRMYRLRRAWYKCLDNIPTHIRRLRGPSELGDLVIHDDVWQTPRLRGGVWYWRVYRPISRPLPWHHWWPDVQLAAALYGVPSEGPIPRDNVTGYKVGWVALS